MIEDSENWDREDIEVVWIGMVSSAAKVSSLDPPLFEIGHNFAHNDLHLWEYLCQPIQAHSSCKVGDENYLLLWDAVINQNLDGHQCGSTAGHLELLFILNSNLERLFLLTCGSSKSTPSCFSIRFGNFK